MILIISEEFDHSTNQIIEWLIYFNADFIRINANDKIKLRFSDKRIYFEEKEGRFKFALDEIKTVWYRRGFLNFDFKFDTLDEIQKFQHTEFIKIKEFIYYKLTKINHINSYYKSDVNRLIVSDIAKEIGLKTPDEFITDNRFDLKKIKKDGYITKSIAGSLMLDFGDTYLVGLTTKIKDLDNVLEDFHPSLVQEYIEKKYELRVFYLKGDFYTMAIFSQKDQQTKVDFRNYNKKNPNRNVSFKLPNSIQEKIKILMTRLGINCGSLDLIVDEKLNFIFLELNPIGQFGMVSIPCNYNLNKIIAKSLINKNE